MPTSIKVINCQTFLEIEVKYPLGFTNNITLTHTEATILANLLLEEVRRG